MTHPLFIELLEKAVQLLHSLVKLLGRQHIVFHRIHLGIIDIEGPPWAVFSRILSFPIMKA